MQNGSEQQGTLPPVQDDTNNYFPEEKEEKALPKSVNALDNPQNNGFL